MTDETTIAGFPVARGITVPTQEAAARMRQRHRADARFRVYGVVAVAMTAVFLIALIADILRTGLPAFWQHWVRLDVELAEATLDPEGKRAAEALAAADYAAIARGAMARAMPGVEGRTAKKQLNELLSAGAADDIRRIVLADPSRIGQTVEARLLLSDNSDLYLKGTDTKVTAGADTRGTAVPSGVTGTVTVTAGENAFAEALKEIKSVLAKRASALARDAARLEKSHGRESQARIDELRAEAAAIEARTKEPTGAEDLDGRLPSLLVALNGGLIKVTRLTAMEAGGDVLLPLATADAAGPGDWRLVRYETPEDNRNISDRAVAFLEKLKSDGRIESGFNWAFFTSGDSREPELAGIRGSLVGSLLTLAVTLIVCLPIGVLAAIYLEKFAKPGRLTDFVEININNLAAVPSIVFGLLGLAVFLNFFGMPRSAPLVGGLVLGLLVMPTIIIAARAALRAVPPSIEEAALGVGASKQQAIFHHVLPLATPGIMTGTIIGMAHALGETAPLLMIGMIAFIVDVPKSFTEAATVLPVQIYLWSDLPEPAFQAKTAAAIIVLLAVLFLLNGTAIWLRKKFETRW